MFENLFKKGVAKAYELMETDKAEKSMTFEQGLDSNDREKIANDLTETGIEVGADLKIEAIAPDNGYEGRSKTRSFMNQYHITGTFNGRKMEFSFEETNVVGSGSREISNENFRCIIDGVEVPSEIDAKKEVMKVVHAAFLANKLLEFDRTHGA